MSANDGARTPFGWSRAEVIGQPLATGLIQKNKEQPFFESLAQKTGLPIEVDYKPLDTTGIKDVDELRVMKSGLFEVASLRMSQVSRDEPTILGPCLLYRRFDGDLRPFGGVVLHTHPRREAAGAAASTHLRR